MRIPGEFLDTSHVALVCRKNRVSRRQQGIFIPQVGGDVNFRICFASMAGTTDPELSLRWLRIPHSFEAFEVQTTECREFKSQGIRNRSVVVSYPQETWSRHIKILSLFQEGRRKWYDTPSHVAKPRLVLGQPISTRYFRETPTVLAGQGECGYWAEGRFDGNTGPLETIRRPQTG